MKLRNLLILLTFALVILASAADAQRTSRIYRPCGRYPPVQAKVEIVNSKRIDIKPCIVASGQINVDAGTVTIGDVNDEVNSTKLIVDNETNTIQLNASEGTSVNVLTAGEISLGGYLVFNPGGAILLDRTLTSPGTTGNRTINAMAGSVNFAAGTSSVTVTNYTAGATSLIFCTIQTNDSTATACRITDRAAGSFTIRLNANATAETSVGFWVTN